MAMGSARQPWVAAREVTATFKVRVGVALRPGGNGRASAYFSWISRKADCETQVKRSCYGAHLSV